MIIVMRRYALIAIALSGLFAACDLKPKEIPYVPQLPFPDLEDAAYLQSRIDSLEFEWYTDVKAVSSIFCNEELGLSKRVDTGDIVVLGEGLFHAKAEAHLPDKVLILTLERPFMNKGTESVWQVVKMEEKKGGTKSG
jgi:hypothetical protein